MILYSHRIDEDNPGDLWSTPKEYFLLDRYYQSNDVFDDKDYSGNFDAWIVGGGDIIVNDKWLRFLQKIKIQTSLKIVWGAGVNYKHQGIVDYLKDFKFIGTRSYNGQYPYSNYEYVPCSSCMNELLDKEYEQKYDTTVINHFKRPVQGIPAVFPSHHIKNKPNTIEDMIETIGQSETIITSSYHAMYWSMLMNKRTLVYIEKPNCKLSQIKHKPNYFYANDFDINLLNVKQDWSGLKEEYREINKQFYEKIQNEYSSSNNS